MRRITPYIVLLWLSVTLSTAKAEFDVNSMPDLIAPMSWDISDSDIKKFAEGTEIEPNNYNAIYFGEMIKVDALIFTKINVPEFSDAQVTVEKLNGRIIGFRVITTDSDPRCWNDEYNHTNCRREDLEGLKKVFINISQSLEKQYGPGIRKKADSNREQSILWKSEQGQLMLYLQEGEYDGWCVGLWIARH